MSNTTDTIDQRITEWFQHEQARHAAPASAQPVAAPVQTIITLSRQFGAGGHTIARLVQERLGPEWKVWDREIIDAVAQSAQVRTEMVRTLDERQQSWMREILTTLFKGSTLESMGYRRYLAQVILALAQQGHVIILGRGANFVLPDALNIRLRASQVFRTQQVMRQESCTHTEAIKKVHKVDHDRAAFTHDIFHHAIDDADHYHMMLQTDRLGFDLTVGVIIAAYRERERLTTTRQ